MKCEICGKEIETTFLNKIKGNYVKVDGKVRIVCNDCFKRYKNDIKSKLKGP
ncbi:MAG: hypothetical protein RAK22_01720 [Nanoarchaeota archaeon]|nr:hypothetical protein [Nanoarchaeota archaeon]